MYNWSGLLINKMVKKIKNKIEFILLLIVMLQVFLLVNMITANSYIIHQADGLTENAEISEEKNNLIDLINSGINLLTGFLSIKQIGIVSADEGEIDYDCCYETNEMGICQDIVSGTDPGLPKSCSSPNPNPCKDTNHCEYGWCFDPDEGLCSSGSPHARCIADGGEWDENWEADKCNEGCCIASKNTQFVTETRCENILEGYIDWSISEIKCKYYSVDEGACIHRGVCDFVTEQGCADLNGDFYEGYLCSHSDLNTDCEKQDYIDCVKGKDEIYWFDSCDNRENIYEGGSVEAEDRSWNNGMILSKEESCIPNSPNIGSTTCGNCGYDFQSICSKTGVGETSVQDGDYICRNRNCDNAPANGFDKDGKRKIQNRKNGEKWCIYEGYVGNYSSNISSFSADVVGSEHWIAHCHDGEVEINPCDNPYRGEICGEKKIPLDGEGKYRSEASCRVNLGFLCYALDPEAEDYKEACEDIPDCRLQTVYVDLDDEEDCNVTGEVCVGDSCISGEDCSGDGTCEDGKVCMWGKCIPEDHCVIDGTCDEGGKCETLETFKFDVCVPKYPKGFERDSTEDMDNGKTICGLATQTCTVVYERQVFVGWTCVLNCDCREQIFVKQMNDFCISLGDCGGYVNVEGVYKKNFDVTGAYQEESESKDENYYNRSLNQTYRNFELIIIDDGSTNNQKEMLEEFFSKRLEKMSKDFDKCFLGTL